MDIKILTPYINWLLLGILGLVFLYIKTFTSEKAKAKALKKANEELEKLKSNYSKEIEEIKKEHQLDISKRKYRYETKSEQYLKFFSLLDELQSESIKNIQTEAVPIMNEFFRNFSKAMYSNNKNSELKATTVLQQKLQSLMAKATKAHTRFKNETNGIRLVASDEVVSEIHVLDLAYEKLFDQTSTMMQTLPQNLILNAQDILHKDQKDLEILGKVIQNLHSRVKEIMRKELNEI